MSQEDFARHYRVDAGKMLDLAMHMPDHIEEAWRMMKSFKAAPPRRKAPVILCGMGGSAIGGKLLLDMIRADATVPIILESGYALPAFADASTSVVCVSYSGDTEETLSCFQNALMRKCPTVVITSGGALAEEADAAGVRVLRVPGGMPPRAALGYLFTPLLALVSKWGVCAVADEEVDSAVRRGRKLVEKYSLEGDPVESRPLQLAKRLYGKTPLMYCGDGLLHSAAYRWKCQFNENAKSMAFANNFPELGHNEIMGWECPERLRSDFFLVMLRDVDDHPRVQRGMEAAYRMLEPLAGGAILVESEGDRGREGRLARLLSVILLGDFTSIYLAVEYGKDPTPIESIDRIKDELKTEDA
jgi:glucose/mannose-6-phosphate isomerase